MTLRLHRAIIGNAWGKPEDWVGREHYWMCLPQYPNNWISGCQEHRIQSDDIFAGIGFLRLLFEHDDEKANRCEDCKTYFLNEVEYGQMYGIHSPGWTPMDGEKYMMADEVDDG